MSKVKKIITDDDEDVIVSEPKVYINNVVKVSKIVDEDDEDTKEVDHSHTLLDCEICCDSKLFLIKCPYCSYCACETCYQRVILSSVTKPSCVSCKKQFNDDFFLINFSDSFIKKKYKKHREEILFKMEEALLPETQPHVERIKRREVLKCELTEIEMQIRELKEKQRQIKEKIIDTYNEKNDDEKEQMSVICPCPANDCRGFLNSKYKCGICGTKACGMCREIKKDKEHKCDPDTVKTVDELKKNCRNCPNCMIPIYKISGCDQMFCVKCRVAFDWKTGKIETGLIHNPHYFEWMRENGGIPRNPHERECGGLPHIGVFYDYKILNTILITSIGSDKVDAQSHNAFHYVTDLFREVLHIQEVVLPRLPTIMDNNTNIDLRIDYLMKKIDKEIFMRKLVSREKDKTKMTEYRQIVEMYYNVARDLINKLIVDLDNDFEFEQYKKIVYKFVEDERNIKDYTNQSINKLKKKYGARSINNL